VTLVLDPGGISALAGQRARLIELRDRGLWPPQVPAVVLAEALTGDPRRDYHANRLLRGRGGATSPFMPAANRLTGAPGRGRIRSRPDRKEVGDDDPVRCMSRRTP
jgi:hypothetical protein